MRKTIPWLALFFVIALVLIALPLVFKSGEGGTHNGAGASTLPWEITPLVDGGSRVFGLDLGRSTLVQARAAFGRESGLGIVASTGEAANLEAFFDSMRAGFITGKLVLRLDPSPVSPEEMIARATKAESLGDHARRFTLSAHDLPMAENARVIAIAFLPTADLDEEIIRQRFGEPTEKISGEGGRQHWFYPQLGLEIQLDPKGKEVLQYVAPREFERLLREPLKSAK